MNPTPDEPRPDVPVDSVTGMHVPHMAAMNEPTMVTVGGDPADDAAGPGGQDSVQGMHGILMREHAEPRDGFEPVPVWVMTVFGALLMWGGYYVGTMSADFRRDVNDTSEFRFAGLPIDPDNPPPDPDPKTVAELVDIGRAKYQAVCIDKFGVDGHRDLAAAGVTDNIVIPWVFDGLGFDAPIAQKKDSMKRFADTYIHSGWQDA